MTRRKYHVELSQDQRGTLQKLTSTGTVKVRTYKRAQMLLLADEAQGGAAKSDGEIAEQVGVSSITVHRIRRRFAEEGLEAALTEKPRPGAPPKFSGKQKAEITALACADPPEGYARWSLRLLADKLVEMEIFESISHDTVGKVLKKTNSSLT